MSENRKAENRERAKAIGERIESRRDELGIKRPELAHHMATTYREVWAWEKGHYSPQAGRHARLAKFLKCTVQYLRTGSEIKVASDQGSPGAGPPSAAADATSGFLDGLSGVLGEPVRILEMVPERLLRSPSCLQALIPLCEVAVNDVLSMTSGRDLREIGPVLDFVVRVAYRARENGVKGSKQLSYDANDAAVQRAIHTVRASELDRCTALHFGQMSDLALDDRSLERRYLSRKGDVLKIRCWDEPELQPYALDVLRRAASLGHKHDHPYYVLRSLLITSATSNDVSDAEFDNIVRMTQESLQSDHLSLHDKSHVIDAIAEANGLRHKQVGGARYKTEALTNMEQAIRCAAEAGQADGKHPLYAMRMVRLPLSIAQTGIIDHLGDSKAAVRDKQEKGALDVLQLANDVGNDRHVEQMTSLLIRLRR